MKERKTELTTFEKALGIILFSIGMGLYVYGCIYLLYFQVLTGSE